MIIKNYNVGIIKPIYTGFKGVQNYQTLFYVFLNPPGSQSKSELYKMIYLLSKWYGTVKFCSEGDPYPLCLIIP